MHPRVAQAIQEIDAAVFGGDTFEDPDDRAELLEYVARWTRELSAVHEDKWVTCPDSLYQYEERAFPVADRLGVTHAVRAWRSGPEDTPPPLCHPDCNADISSDQVTCMACIAEGLPQ